MAVEVIQFFHEPIEECGGFGFGAVMVPDGDIWFVPDISKDPVEMIIIDPKPEEKVVDVLSVPVDDPDFAFVAQAKATQRIKAAREKYLQKEVTDGQTHTTSYTNQEGKDKTMVIRNIGALSEIELKLIAIFN